MKRVTALALAAVLVFSLAGSAAASEVILKIGDHTAYMDGQATTLASAPFIKDGLTFVPLRFVAEALGAQLGWDGQTQTITLALGDEAQTPPPAPPPTGAHLPADLAPSMEDLLETGLDGVTLETLDPVKATPLLAEALARPETSMLLGALEQQGFEFARDAAMAMAHSEVIRATITAGTKNTVDIVNLYPATGPEGKKAVAVVALAKDGTAMYMGHVTDAIPEAELESLDAKTFRVDAWVVAHNSPPYLVHWCYWWYDSHNHGNWYYSWYRWYWWYYQLYDIPWYGWYNWFFHWYHWNHWWYWCRLWPY